MANKEDAREKINAFIEKFNQPNLSRGSTYVNPDGTPQPKYKTNEEEKKMTPKQELDALQVEMNEALPVNLDHPKFYPENNSGDPKKPPSNANDIIFRAGELGGGKKKRRKTRKKKRTKKKAPKKRHRKSKKARKSKKKNSWCKSSKSWCKYTKKNNCKKGLWSKKTKLGRASRKWCKVTKRWCKVNDKTCKKRR